MPRISTLSRDDIVGVVLQFIQGVLEIPCQSDRI